LSADGFGEMVCSSCEKWDTGWILFGVPGNFLGWFQVEKHIEEALLFVQELRL